MMLQANTGINLSQSNVGINIQNARPPPNNMLAQMLAANKINMMAQNVTAANQLFPGVNPLLAAQAQAQVQAQSNAMLAQSNSAIVAAKPTLTQASSIGIPNSTFRPSSQGQQQSNTQTNPNMGHSSSSTSVTQTNLAVLNEKEAQEARNQIATLDARAKERRIQYHEIHDLTDDEKSKIMEKLKELQPMYHEVDKVLPYFWHYTKSSQGTYRLLGMKYMIEDQLKALPDKFLLRLELVDSLLQQFRKYFVFVESRRRGIVDTPGLNNVNPVLPPQQRPQPQVENIIQPRINPSDLKLPKRDNSGPGGPGTKKRRQSSVDGEQPSKKAASSKLPDVMIIDPPSKSAEANATVPSHAGGNSIIIITDDNVKSEEQQLQKNLPGESSQEGGVNKNTISLPLKDDVSEELQKNYIDSDVSMEGVRKQGQRLVIKSREYLKSLQHNPARHRRPIIEGFKPSNLTLSQYDIGNMFALYNTA
ncbi:hypothetical protein RhiirA4_439040 [Rhizophagus irregularis]|uniref:Uncharacterized protein n=1 Tax=Rhizophagus irregularis TaxID=588596 RepID=A0A2I1FUC0_9GLOM|nr:hypothetical protein RhiirA4_439040 [Rhizophagus irregularis]